MDVKCSETGCPPVEINAKGLGGGTALISGQISSQYLSALLMTGPLATGEITIRIKDELVSAPYVHMTMNLMKKFGVTVSSEDDKVFRVQPGVYRSPGSMFIEGDASSASYFLAGGAITGGPVTGALMRFVHVDRCLKINKAFALTLMLILISLFVFMLIFMFGSVSTSHSFSPL